MNRIILIGNGFDRAHGLETAYEHFIDDFWRREIEKIRETGESDVYEDDFIYLKADTRESVSKRLGKALYTNFMFDRNIIINGFNPILENSNVPNSLFELRQNILTYNKNVYGIKIDFKIKNKLLEYISEVVSLQSWVDIEDVYHKFLNAIYDRKIRTTFDTGKKSFAYFSVKELHDDFDCVKKALEEYLMRLVKNTIQQIKGVDDIVYSKFRYHDFDSKGKDAIVEEEYVKISNAIEKKIPYKAARMYENSFLHLTKKQMLNSIKYDLDDYSFFRKDFDLSVNELLFLNFNYTTLERKYIKEEANTIHIHGELNNPANPIIFGYGDELCDEYKELEKLNDNEYLENIKSIKYLETRNYKDLLSFVDSEEYQIFVFGHSCGNSDRTLLNTLFEHQNCVSIKVFYHEWEVEDKTTGWKVKKNNYSDVVRNISRNFGDKKALREKVVNKEFSEALPQAPKSK